MACGWLLLFTGSTLPLEFLVLKASFAPWTPVDSVIWFKVMALDLGGVRIWRALAPLDRLTGPLPDHRWYPTINVETGRGAGGLPWLASPPLPPFRPSLDLVICAQNWKLELERFKLVTEQNLHWDRIQTLLPPFDATNFPIILDEEDVLCDTPGAYEAQCTVGVERTYAESVRGSGAAGLRARRRGQSSQLEEAPSIMVAEKWRRGVTSGRGGLGASNNWVVRDSIALPYPKCSGV